ncbi:MAG: hypothetical protein JST14_01280 [Bacteroidetes bacterium]|nr:hypothetical protein [Bacteroidota bacterium]
MRNYNTWYYLLFVLLVMGAFSSMAQNDYGNTIMGAVGISFAILFAWQMYRHLSSKEGMRPFALLEAASLGVLAALLAARVLYIHFTSMEYRLVACGLMLVIIYARSAAQLWGELSGNTMKPALVTVAFYISMILYCLAVSVAPFAPSLISVMGSAALMLLLVVLLSNLLMGSFVVSGEQTTVLAVISGRRDRSLVLMTAFLLFTAYAALTRMHVIPEMYSDEYPQVYHQLVQSAESGKEKKEDGLYRYEAFKKAYDEFVSNQK